MGSFFLWERLSVNKFNSNIDKAPVVKYNFD